MATITANAGPERMNKWLLIGGVALALLTGVLVFIAVGSLGGSDDGDGTRAVVDGGQVLVARDNIAPGTKVDAGMFRVATFAEDDLVPQPVSDAQSIVGQTTTVEILRGQQISRSHLTLATDDARAEQLAFKLPEGHRGMALGVSEVSAVGGHIVPGDRVDVVVTIEETERAEPEDLEFVRIQTVLQDVLVVAREDIDVNRVVTLGGEAPAEGDEANEDPAAGAGSAFEQRPDDVLPDAGLSTVTVALTPQQVQQVLLADYLGEVSVVLRPFGEDEQVPLEDLRVPVVQD
jgi:pilus assembly protein CpaB